jgi:hypothetical protein
LRPDNAAPPRPLPVAGFCLPKRENGYTQPKGASRS